MEPTLPASSKRILKRIAPLPLGKMAAVIYGSMGLIFLPFSLLIALIPQPQTSAAQHIWVFALGLGSAIAAPVISAVFGFISAVSTAWLYNLLAQWIGGIEVEVE